MVKSEGINRERTKAPFYLREISHRKRDLCMEEAVRTFSLRRYRPLVWDQMGAVGNNEESVVEAELGLGGKLAERVQENDVEAEEEH